MRVSFGSKFIISTGSEATSKAITEQITNDHPGTRIVSFPESKSNTIGCLTDDDLRLYKSIGKTVGYNAAAKAVFEKAERINVLA